MQTLAQYALLGSLLAGAAGALVLVVVTFQHGIKRRDSADEDPARAAARARLTRLADTTAVLCFAVAAGLGVTGMAQQARLPGGASAGAGDDGALAERVKTLEARVAAADEARARAAPAPDFREWDERLTRLETRLGAVEDRAAVAERRALASEQLARERRDERARVAPPASPSRRVPVSAPAASAAAPPAPAVVTKPAPAPIVKPAPAPVLPPPPPGPSASPRTTPVAPEAVVAPEPPAPVRPDITAAPPRPRAPGPPEEPSLGEKSRHDWETVKREARRGGEDWRQGWQQLRRLFAN